MPSGGSVPLVHIAQYLTVESVPLPYSRRVAAAEKGGEGKRWELDDWRELDRPPPQSDFER